MIDIPGFEESYSISWDGYKVFNKKRKSYKKISINDDGYLFVTLWKGGKRKNIKIHRIIAEIFKPNPNLLKTVNHKNGNKTDNRLINLEWCTNEDNLKHAHITGLMHQKGERNSSAKLNWDQVKEIRASKLNSVQLSKIYPVSESTIRHIRQNRIWKS